MDPEERYEYGLTRAREFRKAFDPTASGDLTVAVLEAHRPSDCSNMRCSVKNRFGDRLHCLACQAYKEEYGQDDDYYTHWPCPLADAALRFFGV